MENNLFKFKKASKKIGDFDVNDNTTEWILLRREESFDLPSFVHIQRLWCVEETPDVVDPNSGEVTSKGVKKISTIRLSKGFIKDEKFIATSQTDLPYKTDHEAQKQFIKRLEWFVNDGYKFQEFDQVPTYYANERTPIQDMSGAMSGMMTAINSNPSTNMLIQAIAKKSTNNP